jgi:uncharacterized protein YjbJ (UPF0337 family)
MSDHRLSTSEQYTRQPAESAEAMGLPFYGMAQRGLRATVDWQKFMLDCAVLQSINLVEVHKAVLDAAARQSSAFVDAAQQQFESSITVFTNLTQRWFEDVRTIQDAFVVGVRRVAQEAPVPSPPKKAAEGPERGYRKPEWDRIEREWDQYRDNVHDRWRELSDEALEASRGNRDELARGIQQTYAIGKDEAYNQLDDFLEYVGEQSSAHAHGADGPKGRAREGKSR